MPRKTEIEREETLRGNALSLIEADGCFCYYSNIDYLTVKLVDNTEIVNTLRGLTDNSPNYLLECGGFRIQWESVLYGGQLTVLRLYDDKGNKLGCIHLRNESYITLFPAVFDDEGNIITPAIKKPRGNKNVATDVEFTGDFWKLYGEYFPFFCEFFEIDTAKEKNVTRLDYCIDIAGIDVDEVYKRYRHAFAVGDGKEAKANYVGNVRTGWTDESDRHELQLYNKKLDILKKGKHKIETLSGEKPYLQYIKESFPITRFEYRANARALREDSASVDYCFKYGRQLACSYASKFYDLDLSVFFEDFKRHSFPARREDQLVSVLLGKKAYMSTCMIKAYCSNLRDYKTEEHVFELFYEMYGDRLQEYLMKKHPTREHDQIWETVEMKRQLAENEYVNDLRDDIKSKVSGITKKGRTYEKRKLPVPPKFNPLYEQMRIDKERRYTL